MLHARLLCSHSCSFSVSFGCKCDGDAQPPSACKWPPARSCHVKRKQVKCIGACDPVECLRHRMLCVWKAWRVTLVSNHCRVALIALVSRQHVVRVLVGMSRIVTCPRSSTSRRRLSVSCPRHLCVPSSASQRQLRRELAPAGDSSNIAPTACRAFVGWFGRGVWCRTAPVQRQVVPWL